MISNHEKQQVPRRGPFQYYPGYFSKQIHEAFCSIDFFAPVGLPQTMRSDSSRCPTLIWIKFLSTFEESLTGLVWSLIMIPIGQVWSYCCPVCEQPSQVVHPSRKCEKSCYEMCGCWTGNRCLRSSLKLIVNAYIY